MEGKGAGIRGYRFSWRLFWWVMGRVWVRKLYLLWVVGLVVGTGKRWVRVWGILYLLSFCFIVIFILYYVRESRECNKLKIFFY